MSKSKNILITISSLKVGGGAEKVASNIGTQLNNKNNVHFLTYYEYNNNYDFDGNYKSLDEKNFKNIFAKIWKLFARAYHIKKYCKKNNINTVIAFMEEANFPAILSRILFRNKVRLIVSSRVSTLSKPIFHQKLIKLLYNKADKIVNISKEEDDILIQKFNIKPHKVQAIYNPLDTMKMDKMSKESLGDYANLFQSNSFNFINIGRLSHQKNQSLLIRAFAQINKKYSDTRLFIIGGGILEDELKNLAKQLNIVKSVYFLGVQKNVYKFIKYADCGVFTSLYEGFPNVLTEVMYFGLPIISTDCPTGPKEILKENIKNFQEVQELTLADNGILVQNNHLGQLIQAMQKMYEDKILRTKYAKKSIVKAKQFDIKNIIKQWEKII